MAIVGDKKVTVVHRIEPFHTRMIFAQRESQFETGELHEMNVGTAPAGLIFPDGGNGVIVDGTDFSPSNDVGSVFDAGKRLEGVRRN